MKRLDRLGAGNAHASGRREELNDWFNRRLFHPLARRLALALASSPVSPNQLSVAGGLCVVTAGFCYTLWGGVAGTLAGFGLHLAWHVFDGADGDLARLTGKSSPLGEAVDGICDYLSHILLYAMFGIMLMHSHGPILWWLVAGAGLSRILQASHYEERRREYEFWIDGRNWIRTEGLQPATRTERWMAALVALYLAVGNRTRDGAGAIAILHRKAQGDALSLTAFREAARRALCPLLGSIAMLGATHRTLALGAAMLCGQPLWYFAYELFALNLVLLWSLRAHAKAAVQLERELAPAGAGQDWSDPPSLPSST